MELRWLKKLTCRGDFVLGDKDKYKKVLQFRTWSHQVLEMGPDNVQIVKEWKWSEWEDIPTVTE